MDHEQKSAVSILHDMEVLRMLHDKEMSDEEIRHTNYKQDVTRQYLDVKQGMLDALKELIPEDGQP